jgi:integrase
MKVTLRRKQLKDGRQSLYLDYYHKGKRRYEYLRIYLTGDKQSDKEKLQLAQAIRSKRELEAVSGEFGFDAKFKQETNLYEFLERFAETTKPKRIGIYRQCKRHLLLFTQKEVLRFSDVTPFFLEQWKAYLLSVITSNTARGLFSCLNQVMKQAVKEKIISKNPFLEVEAPKALNIKRDFLTREEIQKLAQTACANPEVKRAFLFACFCGLRLGDIRRLTWANIQDNAIHITQEKTREPLYIPLNQTALQLIGERGEPEEKVFNLPSDSVLSVVMQTWVAQAGITKRVTFHTSRHSFACLALENGVDIFTVSKLLGHSRLETTLVYSKILDSKKREAVNKLPEIEVNL